MCVYIYIYIYIHIHINKAMSYAHILRLKGYGGPFQSSETITMIAYFSSTLFNSTPLAYYACIYSYIYIYIYVYVYIFIYIYISLSLDIYIYIYIYT